MRVGIPRNCFLMRSNRHKWQVDFFTDMQQSRANFFASSAYINFNHRELFTFHHAQLGHFYRQRFFQSLAQRARFITELGLGFRVVSQVSGFGGKT